MARQHASPILVDPENGTGTVLAPFSLASGETGLEASVQQLIHDHPACLPIAEIDPAFAGPIAICRELNTPAGPIDNFMVTPSGLPVLVECKLWRNPEARREVVGQIIDYAKELSRWSSSDLQREVNRRLGCEGNAILDLVRAAGHDIDEMAFNDALTYNLRKGRLLLLIVGDGIRQGVEAIAEYLQVHAGLHFSLGLVEIPVYALADGRRLVVPRVLARTELIARTVVHLPEGMGVREENAPDGAEAESPSDELAADRVRFWSEMLEGLSLDDPDQQMPKVTRQGYVYFYMPAPSSTCWLTVYRNIRDRSVGVFLSYTRNSIGERAVRRLVEDEWPEIQRRLGGTVELKQDKLGRQLIQDEKRFQDISTEGGRERAIDWLRARSNDFVTEFRPRIKAIVADFAED